MGIVKLALAGLAGVQESHVTIGAAEVVYDAQQITAAGLVAAIAAKTPFRAELRGDAPVQPAPGGSRER